MGNPLRQNPLMAGDVEMPVVATPREIVAKFD
jgi:hypothetical protein